MQERRSDSSVHCATDSDALFSILGSMRKRLFGSEPTLARVREDAALRGLRAAVPSYVATGVWGLVTGVAMVNLGLSSVQAIGMSLLVYAGSAQLAVLPLIAAAAPLWVILLTAAVVNLRFVIFSAALFPYFKRFKTIERLLIGSVNTDMGFALFLSRFAGHPAAERGSTTQVWFFLGVAAGAWTVWQVTSIAGVLLAAYVPPDWNLGFAAILALIAMLLPMIVGAPMIVGTAVAGIVAVVAHDFPLRLGLLAAMAAGVAAAMLTEWVVDRSMARRS